MAYRPEEGWWQTLACGGIFFAVNHLCVVFGRGVEPEALCGGVICWTLSVRLMLGQRAMFAAIDHWAGNGWRMWALLGVLFAIILALSELIARGVYGQPLFG